MADDVTFQTTVATPPSGTKVATDDVGGVHYQKVKLDLGGDGASSPVEGAVPVSGTVTVNEPVSVDDNGGSLTIDGTVGVTGTVDVAVASALPAGTNAIGKLAANSGVDIGDVDVTSLPAIPAGNNNIGDVDIASIAAGNNNIGDVDVASLPTSATATLTNVNDTNVSTTLLAANSSRKGATIWNDSTAILYVKFGTTASATSCTVKMVADAYYEVPFSYTGRIDGIWASDASGAARITELT